jgi:phosphoribosyl-AMP cyclohydrolase
MDCPVDRRLLKEGSFQQVNAIWMLCDREAVAVVLQPGAHEKVHKRGCQTKIGCYRQSGI